MGNNYEEYIFTTKSGKKLKVKFKRFVDKNGDSWMELNDALSVEEIK